MMRAHGRLELRADRLRQRGVDVVPGEVAVLDRAGLQRVAHVARGELDLLRQRALAVQVPRADEQRLRAAEDGGGEVVLAHVEEDAVARGGRLAEGDGVPEAEAERLDEHEGEAGGAQEPAPTE